MDIFNLNTFAVRLSGRLVFNSKFQSLVNAGTFDPEVASDTYAQYSRLFDIADYRYSKDGIELHDCNYLFNPEPETQSIYGPLACLDHHVNEKEDAFIYLDRVISCAYKMMEAAGVLDIEQIAILLPNGKEFRDDPYLSERILACCLRETSHPVHQTVRARLIAHSVGEMSIESTMSKWLWPYLEDEDIYIDIKDDNTGDRRMEGYNEILLGQNTCSHMREDVIGYYLNQVSLTRCREYSTLFSF